MTAHRPPAEKPTTEQPPAYRQAGLRLTEHVFTVPLDHHRPDGEHIEVFAREVTAPGADSDGRPWLLYLEGGPGCAAPRPLDTQTAGGWLARAARDYRVLLMDQRGTGRSAPLNRQTLPLRGTARHQAEHLPFFRADSIVRDAEMIRRQLTGGRPWSVLGQSFGGFCTVTYLCLAPEGLREAFIVGGLPGLDSDAETVYRAAYPRMERKNVAYYARYPEDEERARSIARHLREHEVVLPGGLLLTAEAFQSLGILLGTIDGATRLHYLLEGAFLSGTRGPELSDAFQHQVQSLLSFATRPLYAVLHEAAYAQDGQPTAWAAERVRAEFPQFDACAALEDPHARLLFTGETIHPWHFRIDPALRPLRDTAQLLAEDTSWTPLYDKALLAANQVPTCAVVYQDDLYVDAGDSLRTAAAIGSTRTVVTGDHEHDGLAASGTAVLDMLLTAARGDG
ncbi:alpha/beta hydrolase [Streptomyces sp. SID13666]|uniref:alpha/beta fold hydrolase n=1 Tax=unclassified Streptomyces TaxID=2593676 RepID=UPI0013C2380F|nr:MULTISPECIES: alpha/beta fold hydrolase [unclassified Streptomyces]NEA54252.1 alpha/beta hydrolase [Streptomyces sp. SID13666]NEA70347.1 alpha/beta hydrolase [Streptomyces sp. SID13588]